mgnify:CR=1 FL=1
MGRHLRTYTLLRENFATMVDKVIVIYSDKSNYGNSDDRITELVFTSKLPCQWINLEPDPKLPPHQNEVNKRNFGIKIAKEQGFTHFISGDMDEFYKKDEFEAEKERVEMGNMNGIVCPLHVYIKSPTLFCREHTLVPAIHKLYHNTQLGNFMHYPFNRDEQGNCHIDPCRRINCFDRIQMSEMVMYHLSYVRKNIDLKIDNSSANLRRSRQIIYDELSNAAPGYMSKLYHKPMEESPNYFNIEI